jgi:hypothetical protein
MRQRVRQQRVPDSLVREQRIRRLVDVAAFCLGRALGHDAIGLARRRMRGVVEADRPSARAGWRSSLVVWSRVAVVMALECIPIGGR